MRRAVTKSIAIIGEGETEWFYFDSLRVACRYPFKVAPDFPQHSDINHILKLVESYLNKQYDYIVCLFDMDRLFLFPSEMQLYQRAKKKYRKEICKQSDVCGQQLNTIYNMQILNVFKGQIHNLVALQSYHISIELTVEKILSCQIEKMLSYCIISSSLYPNNFITGFLKIFDLYSSWALYIRFKRHHS